MYGNPEIILEEIVWEDEEKIKHDPSKKKVQLGIKWKICFILDKKWMGLQATCLPSPSYLVDHDKLTKIL